jgi:uncharacterized protein (DUF1919 family)
MRIEVLPDPLDNCMNVKKYRLTERILRWTDNEIDTVPFKGKVALDTQPERCFRSILIIIAPRKDGIIETNTIIKITLNVVQCPNLLFRKKV